MILQKEMPLIYFSRYQYDIFPVISISNYQYDIQKVVDI